MIKGGTDGFAVKGGDAAAGPLKLMFDGPRPHGCERQAPRDVAVPALWCPPLT